MNTIQVPACPKVMRLLGRRIRVDEHFGEVKTVIGSSGESGEKHVATVEVFDDPGRKR